MVTKELQILFNHGLLDASMYKTIKPVGTHWPQLYGKVKTHKVGNSVRTILSMCDSPYYMLSKWLLKILSPVRERFSSFSLNNKYSLLPYLEGINVNDKILASFDISSLFTKFH